MTPALLFTPASGELGRSIDTIDESRTCRDVRDVESLSVLRYRPSSLPVCLLSLLCLLLEKKPLPPDNCLDLSADDMSRSVEGRAETPTLRLLASNDYKWMFRSRFGTRGKKQSRLMGGVGFLPLMYRILESRGEVHRVLSQ